MTSETLNNNNTLTNATPTWFNNAKLMHTYENYSEYEYIDLIIQVSKDKSMFNATNLIKQMKDKQANMTALMSSQKWSYIQEDYSEQIKFVEGKGTQSYKGYWFTWTLFDVFVESVIPTSSISFNLGRKLSHNDKGYIYMCKPKDCKDSNTFKFGKTWNWNQRVKQYGEGTQLIYLLSHSLS